MQIRATETRDIAALEAMLDRMEMFPSDMLADMIAPFFDKGEVAGIWITCELEGAVAGFCYAAPEQMTDGTWNMLAIAVDPLLQGKGCGAAMAADLERRLAQSGQRLLIVDTSGKDGFAPTRNFYLKNGYREEARISDFWASGDDKVTFSKSLR